MGLNGEKNGAPMDEKDESKDITNEMKIFHEYTEITHPVPVRIPPPRDQATYHISKASSYPVGEIDHEFVLKFSRICAPICQIMSIGISMYYWNVYLISKCNSAESCDKFYYLGEVSLFVGGLFCLLALFLAFIKNFPNMFMPFYIYQCIACFLGGYVVGYIVTRAYFAGKLTFSVILLIVLFLAFACFASYTLQQVIRLRKLMAREPSNRTGGVTTFFFSPEGTAVPV